MADRKVGGNAGKGRKKGVPNKLTTAAREAFALAFQQSGGTKGLTEWAKSNPGDFYKLYARLIPVEMQHSASGTLAELLAKAFQP